MRPSLLFLLLITLVLSTNALTSGEENALEGLLSQFPSLTTCTPPWTSNVSVACDDPPFYGLSCSNGDDKHVLKMYGAI